jgi:hypothetical protein
VAKTEKMIDERVELTRPEFLKLSLATGISLSALLTNAYLLLDSKSILPPEHKERHLIVTPEGYQIGVILGNHGTVDPKTGQIETQGITQIDIKDLFIPIGAFFNDGWTNSLSPRVTGDMVEGWINDVIQLFPAFYQDPFEYGLRQNIPFIFGDINLKEISLDELSQASDYSRKAMISAMATMIAKGGEAILERYTNFLEQSMSRRQLLKLPIAAGTLNTLYLTSPAFVHLFRELEINSGSKALRDFQAIFSDLIHPNNYAVVMRNIVWALKCKDLFEADIIPNDKIINIPGGLRHQFLDFFSRNPETATKYWELFGYNQVAGMFSEGDTNWVHQSRIFYPSTKQTEIINHKSLERLAV